MYTLHEGWRPKSGSPPLLFGNAVHKALERFYLQPRTERGEFPEDFEAIAQTIAQGHAAPDSHFLYDCIQEFVSAGSALSGLPATDKRSLTSGIWMLSHYFRTYFHDTYVTYVDDNGPCIERTFEVPLVDTPNLKIILFGTIDFIFKNEVTGHLLCGDHKTSSQMGSEFLNRIKPNHQYTGYLMGARKALGIETNDFLINGIQTKSRPLTSRGGPPTFTRQITKRDDGDFIEFTEVVTDAVTNYLRWTSTDKWPLGSVDSCAMWGGCQFLDVCSGSNFLRRNILEAKFTRNAVE